MRTKHNYRTINQLKNDNYKLKRKIIILIIPAFIGYWNILELGWSWIDNNYFIPKTIVFNRAYAGAVDNTTPDVMAYIRENSPEGDGEAAGTSAKPSLTGVFTSYNPVPEQTDGDPFTMASGKKVFNGAVANNCLPFGTKIRTELGEFTVEDRMNSRFTQYCGTSQERFDIFKWEKSDNIGKRELSYQIIN